MKQPINYVIATYAGSRRINNSDKYNHPSNCLTLHINKLLSLKHDLSQITFVMAKCRNESLNKQLRDEIQNLVSRLNIQNIQTAVIERENQGLSYGSFWSAFLEFGKMFDWYITVEDDYVPIQDNFDSKLIHEIESKPASGFVCSKATPNKRYAQITTGIVRAEAFDKIKALGITPYSTGESSYNSQDQILFAEAFGRANYTVEDFADKYSSPFLTHNGYIQTFGQGPIMFSPIQLLDK